MNMNPSNGQATQVVTWNTLSVRDFFGQIPWTGAPTSLPALEAITQTSIPAMAEDLEPKLTVSEFFYRFPWDGKPNIAAPIAPMEVKPDLPQGDNITLDGFADLF